MIATISKSNYTFDSVSDWLTRLNQSYENSKMTMWDFAVTLAAGVDQFGRTDPRKQELYELASQQLGLTVGTIKTYASAARSPVASLAIEKDLTFQHARAVLGLPHEVADSLLSDAVANGWSAERLSQRAWAERNAPNQRTLTSQPQAQSASEIARRNGYHDDLDARADAYANDPGAYDDVPFSHGDDGYVWDTQREQWRHVDQPAEADSLWTDERIAAMVDSVACDVEYTDADGLLDYRQYVQADDVCRLLRTMRDEYEIMRSRR